MLSPASFIGRRRGAPCTAAFLLVAFLPACADDPLLSPSMRAPRTEVPAPSAMVTTLSTPEPTQVPADSISANIQALHLPYGTIADPRFADSTQGTAGYTQIEGYEHAGDAAIWTGHYLAAEAFRHQVTGSPEALANVRRAVSSLQMLVDVTTAQPGLLARFYVPQDAPYAADIIAFEKQFHYIGSSTVNGRAYWWLGNTSRDQYSGVFFGLGVAHDLVGDAAVRSQISSIVTRLLDDLLQNGWNVKMPDGTTSTTFSHRADQRLSFLQVGRRVNPTRFGATYTSHRKSYASSVKTPIDMECTDPYGSYYKFNLNHINLYNLIRFEEATSSYRSTYLSAFNALRNCTGSHQNAHFNMVDRVLRGANETRDAATVDYLGQWLLRRARNYPVDLTAKYQACATDRACNPVPVYDRPNTDFLWQRSPFKLTGTGTGRTETAAIDYLLPYWMARHQGMLTR